MSRSVRFSRYFLRALLAAYLVFPVAFFSSLRFRQVLIFGTYIVWPFHDYTKPAEYGLPYSRNFYVNSVGDIRLGAWYIPPKGIWDKMSKQASGHEPQPWMLDDNRPVIIYYHGHAQCRACNYRVGLYKTLSQSEKLDAHVFTFDYRGFADSTQVLPDREGVLHDSTVMFDYVRKLVKNNDSRILIWGHSLGTGIAVQLIEAFTELHRSPMGVVLEAPFNSLAEAAYEWPINLPYRFIPSIEIMTNKLKEDDETFYETEQLASSVNVPILMIHSPDDALISFDLGQKLLGTLRALSKAPVHFYQADDSYSLGHRYIFKDPKVQDAVADFIRRYSNMTLPETESSKADSLDASPLSEHRQHASEETTSVAPSNEDGPEKDVDREEKREFPEDEL